MTGGRKGLFELDPIGSLEDGFPLFVLDLGVLGYPDPVFLVFGKWNWTWRAP